MAQVDRYAETVLAQRLSMVTGVAQVNVFGAQKFAVRVDLDPTQLAARQIGIDQVTQRDQRVQRQPADRHAVRPEPQLRRAVERPVDVRRPVPADRGRLPQRQPRPARRSRARLRRRREPAQRQLVQRQAGALPRRPAPARHQHRRSRRSGQGAAARAAGAAARLDPAVRSAAIARSRSASRCTTSSSRSS